jgi:carboxyl-terminal processing protease
MKVTNAKFYRISGGSTQHRGVIPDILYPEIYDIDKIGESALEEALPWNKIDPSKYVIQGDISTALSMLQTNHNLRIKNNPDFTYLNEQVDFLKELRNDTVISLNIETREIERKQTEQRRLDLENKRRKAKGMELLTELKDSSDNLDDVSEHDDKEKKSEDALLIEGGEILVDYLKITSK